MTIFSMTDKSFKWIGQHTLQAWTQLEMSGIFQAKGLLGTSKSNSANETLTLFYRSGKEYSVRNLFVNFTDSMFDRFVTLLSVRGIIPFAETQFCQKNHNFVHFFLWYAHIMILFCFFIAKYSEWNLIILYSMRSYLFSYLRTSKNHI